MKMSKFKYSFSEAKKNVTRNGLMSVASLFTIACCLIILGLFTVITMNVNYITSQIKDECEVQLFLKDDTSEERVKEIGIEIKNIENVKEASLFTKQDMLDYAKQDMFQGKEELYNGLDEDNPFSDSYKITLVDIQNTADTVKQLSEIDGADHVVNNQDVVNMVLSFSSVIKKFSIAVMLVLLLVAIVIISNTVKLTVFNRRKEINIMKYIGATDRFIRIPFVLEGAIIGFLGAVLAFLLVFWGYFALMKYMAQLEITVFSLVSTAEVAPVIGVLFVIFGCLIGVSGSVISMRKYLEV